MKSGKGVHSELLWNAIQGYRFREETSINTRYGERGLVCKACVISGNVESSYRERRKERNKESAKGRGSFHEIMSE
jgi:hypothetical protein